MDTLSIQSWILLFLHYGQLYGARIFLILVLSIVTVFRREISCNRVYVSAETKNGTKNPRNASRTNILCDRTQRQGGNRHEEDGPMQNDNTRANMQYIDFQRNVHFFQHVLGNTICFLFHWVQTAVGDTNSCRRRLHVMKNRWIRMCRQRIPSSIVDRIQKYDSLRKYCRSEYSPTNNTSTRTSSSLDFLFLPQDVQIHIFTFLTPRDVLIFGNANRITYTMVHHEGSFSSIPAIPLLERWNIIVDGKTSRSATSTMSSSQENHFFATCLWFSLWKRDYSCILTDWEVGRKAVQRSLTFRKNRPVQCPSLVAAMLGISSPDASIASFAQELTSTKISMKDFYFYFSQTWINYTIAGHCTFHSCLVGLHGHVFNLLEFIGSHPGSPETLLMLGAGRDATKLFEQLGHSSHARKIAMQKLLVVRDEACCPTTYHSSMMSSGEISSRCGLTLYPNDDDMASLPSLSCATTTSNSTCRRYPRKPPTTLYYQQVLVNENQKVMSRAKCYRFKEEEKSRKVGPIQVFFDPICQEWMGWYIDSNFAPVFVDKLAW